MSFFGPLKKHWGTVCHQFYQDSPGKVVTRFNFNELFSKAWLKAITLENLCSGFQTAGIVPFNPQALLKLIPEENPVEGQSSEGRPPPTEKMSASEVEVSKWGRITH